MAEPKVCLAHRVVPMGSFSDLFNRMQHSIYSLCAVYKKLYRTVARPTTLCVLPKVALPLRFEGVDYTWDFAIKAGSHWHVFLTFVRMYLAYGYENYYPGLHPALYISWSPLVWLGHPTFPTY